MFSLLFLSDLSISFFKWKLTVGSSTQGVDDSFSLLFFALAYSRNRYFLCTSLHFDHSFFPISEFMLLDDTTHELYLQSLSFGVEISISNPLRTLIWKTGDFGTQVEMVIIYFRKTSNFLLIKSTKTHILLRILCSFLNSWHVFWIIMDILWEILKLWSGSVSCSVISDSLWPHGL